jgi:phage integrase family
MASLVERKNRYYVVYTYENEAGEKKQKWESCKTKADAQRRKSEVEYRQELGSIVISQCETMADLLKEYISMYGKNNWALSTYTSNINMINAYILPHLGQMKLGDITARSLEKYYQTMLKARAVPKCTDNKHKKTSALVSAETVRRIHKLLHSCFEQAVRWDLMIRNPADYATVPKSTKKQREIWNAETLMRAVELCGDSKLRLAINLAFACSLRIGELLGLTWSCIDVSDESIKKGVAYVYVNKELQRVNRSAMQQLDEKDVIFAFPVISEKNRTQLVLKKPKTLSSIRKVFLPRTVAKMLILRKEEQEELKEALGSEYSDYDLVFAGDYGMPTEASTITESFKKLIKEHDLPPVVFHSLRHSSITYKLKLNGGDIKAVQGDSGHAQAKMVTDQYSHILDDDRQQNAKLFEKAFYRKDIVREDAGEHLPAVETKTGDALTAGDRQLLEKLMSDESTATLLMNLLKKLS